MSYAAKTDFAGPDDAKIGASRRRAILAWAIGNFFELFDFTIYGYFAVAIARAFYPSGSMYGTYAAFGSGISDAPGRRDRDRRLWRPLRPSCRTGRLRSG